MYDTGLAERLRRRGVPVVEVAGWRTRGSSVFNPRGSVNHHTAGSANGVAPSLNICIYGRSGLPGPLCQVLLGRDLRAYLIAAGRANHAGSGGWQGLSGNSSVYGLEIEHVGHGPSKQQLDMALRVHAAFLEGPTASRNAGLVCQHFEWAPTRKIDFRDLSPYSPGSFRGAIDNQLKSGPNQEDEDMPYGWTEDEYKTVLRNIIKQELPALIKDHVPDGVQAAIVKGGISEASFEARVAEGVKAAVQTGGMAENDVEARVNEALVAVLTVMETDSTSPLHNIVRQVLNEDSAPEPPTDEV